MVSDDHPVGGRFLGIPNVASYHQLDWVSLVLFALVEYQQGKLSVFYMKHAEMH